MLESQGIKVVGILRLLFVSLYAIQFCRFANLTAFNHMVDKMELGLRLIYSIFGQFSLKQVIQPRDRTNVLLYYTADRPDGSGGPFSDVLYAGLG